MKRYYIKGNFVSREGHMVPVEDLIDGYNSPYVIAAAKNKYLSPSLYRDGYTFVGECSPAVNTFEKDGVHYE